MVMIHAVLADAEQAENHVLNFKRSIKGCRRYVTTDAMGMAKERGRREDEQCRWCRNRVGHKHGEGHHDVPRFGALSRDNTPTPACLLYINENKNYNECSLSCIKRRDLPWAWSSP